MLLSALVGCGNAVEPTQASTKATSFKVDFRDLKTQANSSSLSAQAMTNDLMVQLETEPYVHVTFSDDTELVYENLPDGMAVTDEDQGLGTSDEIGDNIVLFESAYLGNSTMVVPPQLYAASQRIKADRALSAQSASAISKVRCTFWFIRCWRYNNPDYRWNNGVPYTISPGVVAWKRHAIQTAINDWNARVARPKWVLDSTGRAANRVDFVDGGYSTTSCGVSQYLGNSGGYQFIRLNDVFPTTADPQGQRCYLLGMVQHEMGHAVGLIHEHQRCDRDNYVISVVPKLCNGNISAAPGSPFLDNDQLTLLTTYDFDSVMHYSRNTSARTYLVPRAVITAPYHGDPSNMGTRALNNLGLNSNDIIGIARLYQ